MINGHDVVDLRFKRHHDEMREYWQAKALLHTNARDRKLFAVVMSMLAHVYGIDPFRTLMKVCFPGMKNIRPPFFASAGKIMKSGEVAADLVQSDRTVLRHSLVFKDMSEMEGAFRTLADELKLNDTDRAAMFDCLRKWIVADFRRDPNRTEAA